MLKLNNPNRHKIDISKQIKEVRYSEKFFEVNIFPMYPLLHFIAEKFDFKITNLVELLLENLYNEGRIDEYVNQIKEFEDNEKPIDTHHALLGAVLNQHLTISNANKYTKHVTLLTLKEIKQHDFIIHLFGKNLPFLKVHYVNNKGDVKFQDKITISDKVLKIVPKLANTWNYFVIMTSEYLFHMNETLFLNTDEVNKEIEILLTRYYRKYNEPQPRT